MTESSSTCMTIDPSGSSPIEAYYSVVKEVSSPSLIAITVQVKDERHSGSAYVKVGASI